MPAKRTTLMMSGFLLLCILLGSLAGYQGGIIIKTEFKEMAQNSKENSEYGTSVKSVRVTIQADQQELLFDQLRQFAEKNFFAIRITTTSFDPSYNVEMWREDVQIGGSFYPDSGELGLDFCVILLNNGRPNQYLWRFLTIWLVTFNLLSARFPVQLLQKDDTS
jgi:hypothetical protein